MDFDGFFLQELGIFLYTSPSQIVGIYLQEVFFGDNLRPPPRQERPGISVDEKD